MRGGGVGVWGVKNELIGGILSWWKYKIRKEFILWVLLFVIWIKNLINFS